jgi:hypothetical protein
MSYQFGSAVAPGYPEIVRSPSCGGLARPGAIGLIEGSAITGRGIIGGRRLTRRKAHRGGVYGASFDNSIVVGTRGAYMPVQSVGCRGAAAVGGKRRRNRTRKTRRRS